MSDIFNPAETLRRVYAEFERLGKASEIGTRLANGTLEAPVAQTPKQTIWALNKAKLYHYYPQAPIEKRHRVPILLVFALINRPYIFDLRPGSSFVEFMVRQGYDVYLIDWGAPGIEDAEMDFESYTLTYLPRAIRAMQRHSGSRQFSLLGWCIGAILTTIYAAMRGGDDLRNLILLTAPLDFSNKQAMGPFPRWLDARYFNIDAILAQTGNMPGELIDVGNKLLKPVENYLGNNLRLLDNLDNQAVVESWKAMNTWVTDAIPFAGAAYRQLIVEFYRENRLMNGTLHMGGEIVDVGKVRANLLNIIAEQDHIVPPCQSYGILERVGSSDTQQILLKGGHIGVMAGSSARKQLWPQIDAWLASRSH
ncbi:MAG: alpha/beta fold hydrolase [Roseiflexaceae bacterium]